MVDDEIKVLDISQGCNPLVNPEFLDKEFRALANKKLKVMTTFIAKTNSRSLSIQILDSEGKKYKLYYSKY